MVNQVNKSGDTSHSSMVSSAQDPNRLYDIDLDVQKIKEGNAFFDFGSMFFCGEGTVASQCGGFGCSAVPTCLCTG